MREPARARHPSIVPSLLVAVSMSAAPAALAAERAHPELWEGLQARAPEAVEAIVHAYDAEPSDPELMMLRALAFRSEGDLEAADELAEEAIEAAPEVAEFHSLKAEIMSARVNDISFFRRLGYAKIMLGHFERAVELAPDDIEARESLMGYHLNAPGIAGGDRDVALEQIEAIRALHPARGHLAQARMHLIEDEQEAALAAIGTALETAPEDPEVRMRSGFLYQGMQRWEPAFEVFESIVALDPEHPGAAYQIGRTAVFSETRLERGEQALRRYLELEPGPGDPTHADARWRLGLIAELMGQPDAARQHYREALELVPGHPQATESLEALD